MEEDIENYLPTVMCRGTPCTSILTRHEYKIELQFHDKLHLLQLI